jgi:uncharacterized protein (DUF58 family)
MAISGRVPLLLLVGVIPVILLPVPLVVIGWALLVVLAVLADLLLAIRPDHLRIARDLPASVRLTEPATSRLTVTNPGTRTARLRMRDAWPPSAGTSAHRPALRLRGGESLRQVTTLLPTRRGDVTAGAVTVRSFGPLGLAARQRSLAVPGVLRVLPEFRSRSHLPYRLARLRELDGQASVHVRGQGTEFDSLREYSIGDDVRSIDWRASARAVKTMVRTWRPERDRHILMVLDTSRWAAGRIGGKDGTAAQTRLDAGIETCLLMGSLGAASGDRLSLLAADRQVQVRLPGTARSGSVLNRFANGLSQVEPVLTETDWAEVAAEIDRLCRQRSLVILVTGLDPAIYAEGLGTVLPTLAHDHQLIIAHVTDPAVAVHHQQVSDVKDVYDAAATGRLELAMLALADRVTRMGVEIVRAGPDQLAPAVCDRYLALKAAGRL